MTDKFVVPEPSREAVDALRDTKLRSHSFDEVRAMASLVLRVDVPAIVQAEVERALLAMYQIVDAEGNCCYRMAVHADAKTYLAARFPEAAPEGPEVTCFKKGHDFSGSLTDECQRCKAVFSRHGSVTSTPPERREPGHCGASNDGEDSQRCCKGWAHNGSCARPDTETAPVYTDAERDFLRALAGWLEGGTVTLGEPRFAKVSAAARRVVAS